MPIDALPGPNAAAPTLRVRSPEDLIQAIPYLLGFHPTDSLVVVGLRHSRVSVTARVDLSEVTEPGLARHLVHALRNADSCVVVALVYANSPTEVDRAALPHGAVVQSLGAEIDRAGLEFLDALLVANGHWWSYCCTDDACCFSRGTPIGVAPSIFAAEATVAGMVALPNRAAVAALLEPASTFARESLHEVIARHENGAVEAALAGRAQGRTRSLKRAIFAAARAFDDGDAVLTDDQVARFGVGLSEIDIRDSVWMAVDDGRLVGAQLWRELARRLPSPYDAGPLFLVGWSAWRAGNGVLASIASQRAVESDPQYSAADLLSAALSRGVDPRRVPRLRQRSA